MIIKKKLVSLWRNDRGASMLEFALVLLILLTLIFGIFEFGWILHGYITLSGAARDGVRVAVVGGVDNLSDVRDIVKDRALIFPLADEDIDVDFGSFGEETTITVQGSLPLLVGFFPLSNPFDITVEATMRQEAP